MKPTFLPVHYLVRTEDERMGFIISSVEAGMPLAEMCPAYVVCPAVILAPLTGLSLWQNEIYSHSFELWKGLKQHFIRGTFVSTRFLISVPNVEQLLS